MKNIYAFLKNISILKAWPAPDNCTRPAKSMCTTTTDA